MSQNESMNRKLVVAVGGTVLLLMALTQNCSEVSFTEAENLRIASGDPDLPEQPLPVVDTPNAGITPVSDIVIICNPLSGDDCDQTTSQGLIGNLFYLLPGDVSADLLTAKLDDYRDYGTRVSELILFSNINVSPRSWTSGFSNSNTNDSLILDANGDVLLEWFSLDLAGFIEPPEGEYEFAMISDDGMEVSIDNQIIISDDGTHAPRVKCGAQSISFDGTSKPIQVRYFQGPRNQVAMQLYMKAKGSDGSCSNGASQLSGHWQVVPEEYLYH